MSQGNMLNFLDSARVYMDSALQKPGTSLTRTVNLRRFLQRNILKRSSPLKLSHTGPLRQCRRRKSSASKSSSVLGKAAETSGGCTSPSDGPVNSQCVVSKMPNSGSDSSVVYINCSPVTDNLTSHGIKSSLQFKSPLDFTQPDSYLQMADPTQTLPQHQAQIDPCCFDQSSFQSPYMAAWSLPAHALGQQAEPVPLPLTHQTAAGTSHGQSLCDEDMLSAQRYEDLGQSTHDILYNSMLNSGLTFTLPEPDALCGSDEEENSQVTCTQSYVASAVPPLHSTMCVNESPSRLENHTPFCSGMIPRINLPLHELSEDTDLNDFFDMMVSPADSSDSGQAAAVPTSGPVSCCGKSFTAGSSAIADVCHVQPASPLEQEFSFINAFLGLDSASPDIPSVEPMSVNCASPSQDETQQQRSTMDATCAELFQEDLSQSVCAMNMNYAMSLQNGTPEGANPLDANCAVSFQYESLENISDSYASCAVSLPNRSSKSMDTLHVSCAASFDTSPPVLTTACEESPCDAEVTESHRQNKDSDDDECLQQLFTAIEIISSTETSKGFSDFDTLVGDSGDYSDMAPSTPYLCGAFPETTVSSPSGPSASAVYSPDQQSGIVSLCTQTDTVPVSLETMFSPVTSSSSSLLTAVPVDPSPSSVSPVYSPTVFPLPEVETPVCTQPQGTVGTNFLSAASNVQCLAYGKDNDLNLLLDLKTGDNCIPLTDIAKGFSLSGGESSTKHSFGVSDVLLTLAQGENDHFESIQNEHSENSPSTFENSVNNLAEFFPKPLDTGSVNKTPAFYDDHSEYFSYLEEIGSSFSTIDEVNDSVSPSAVFSPPIADHSRDIFFLHLEASGTIADHFSVETTTSAPKTERGVQTSIADQLSDHSSSGGKPEQGGKQGIEFDTTTEETTAEDCEEKSLFSDCSNDYLEGHVNVLSECLGEHFIENDVSSFSSGIIKFQDSMHNCENISAFEIHPNVIDDDGSSTDDDRDTEWNPTEHRLPPFHLVFLTNVNRLYKNMQLANPECHEWE